mgnify:CR=1 FL=1
MDTNLSILAAVALASVFLSASASHSSSQNWSCTPPVEGRSQEYVSSMSNDKLKISRNKQNEYFVTNILRKRLDFRDEIVSCNGSTCQFSSEFQNLIGDHGDLSMPRDVTICSMHQDSCQGICKSSPFPSYAVWYFWKDGFLQLNLGTPYSKESLLGLNEVPKHKIFKRPDVRDFYVRNIGVTPKATISIQLTIFKEKR